MTELLSTSLRRIHTLVDDVDGLRRVAVAAVVANPWAGRGFVADLQPEVRELCPPLAREVMTRIVQAYDGLAVEAFGKAVVVGADVEVEHGDALIHTPFFSDIVRDVVGGTSVISSTEARGSGAVVVPVPLCHITHASTRTHYQGFEVSLPAAPAADEIVVIVATASGGRRDARIGDRTTDPAFDPTPWRPAA